MLKVTYNHLEIHELKKCKQNQCESGLVIQSLKPYKQSSISKIILHFHFSLPILLDVVFDLIIKAQTLYQTY